jgi:DNA-binding LacI/PurR family transcriptional regulator
LQRALDKLQRQGLLRPRGRLGTFVCDRPPQLHRIGVVHAAAPQASIWTRTIARVAQEITAEERYRLDCYLGAERQPDGTPTASLCQLETDLQEHLLAGAILYTAPDEAIDLLVRSGLPGVQIAHPEKAGRFPAIVPASTTERAMQRFESEGRQRLAILTTFNYRGAACDAIIACARAHGLQTRHAWIHYFEPRSNPSARAVAELLMSLPRRQRPDAVYINDDHLVREAVLGLADAGVRVPRDLSVIAYANFPNRETLALPVTRLGPDIGRVLRTAVGLIEDQLAGRKPAPLTTLQPVFEEVLHEAVGDHVMDIAPAWQPEGARTGLERVQGRDRAVGQEDVVRLAPDAGPGPAGQPAPEVGRQTMPTVKTEAQSPAPRSRPAPRARPSAPEHRQITPPRGGEGDRVGS